MKLLTFTVITTGTIALLLTAGCGRSLQERFDRAKQSAQDEQRGIQQSEPDPGRDYADEWQDFQTEAEAQIAANTRSLDAIRLGMSRSDDKIRATVEAQIQDLTKKNGELKEQLDGYRDQGRLNWNAFKRDFSHDLDGLSKAVKDLQ